MVRSDSFGSAVLGVLGTRIVQRVLEVDGQRIAVVDANDRRRRKLLVDKTEVRVVSADPGTGCPATTARLRRRVR